MNTAIYPGTFDPITFGHIDVIKKSLNIFDRVIVATTDNTDKEYFFSIEERLNIINHSLFKDLKFDKKKTLIAMGRFHENKGFDVLIKSLSFLSIEAFNILLFSTKKSPAAT